MRDYAVLINALKAMSNTNSCFYCQGEHLVCEANGCILSNAADAIEELQNQIAEYGKMVDRINGLIEKMQGKADEAREAERYHYGSAGTVSQYTWVHNAKCIHERFVRDLEDLILPLYGEANADS